MLRDWTKKKCFFQFWLCYSSKLLAADFTVVILVCWVLRWGAELNCLKHHLSSNYSYLEFSQGSRREQKGSWTVCILMLESSAGRQPHWPFHQSLFFRPGLMVTYRVPLVNQEKSTPWVPSISRQSLCGRGSKVPCKRTQPLCTWFAKPYLTSLLGIYKWWTNSTTWYRGPALDSYNEPINDQKAKAGEEAVKQVITDNLITKPTITNNQI